jgi:hypothetical protein
MRTIVPPAATRTTIASRPLLESQIKISHAELAALLDPARMLAHSEGIRLVTAASGWRSSVRSMSRVVRQRGNGPIGSGAAP